MEKTDFFYRINMTGRRVGLRVLAAGRLAGDDAGVWIRGCVDTNRILSPSEFALFFGTGLIESDTGAEVAMRERDWQKMAAQIPVINSKVKVLFNTA